MYTIPNFFTHINQADIFSLPAFYIISTCGYREKTYNNVNSHDKF